MLTFVDELAFGLQGNINHELYDEDFGLPDGEDIPEMMDQPQFQIAPDEELEHELNLVAGDNLDDKDHRSF
ncbi:hypothetical protein FRC06_003873, partial [Ceratobasidium sp. 370]